MHALEIKVAGEIVRKLFYAPSLTHILICMVTVDNVVVLIRIIVGRLNEDVERELLFSFLHFRGCCQWDFHFLALLISV